MPRNWRYALHRSHLFVSSLGILLFLFNVIVQVSEAARVVVRPPVEGAPPSNAYQNMNAAIDFLGECGEHAAATELRRKLNQGDLGYDTSQSESGDTDTSGNITVNGGMIGDSGGGSGPVLFDPNSNGGYSSILSLARTLFHERTHLGHGRAYRAYSNAPGDSEHEIESWTQTLRAMVRWIRRALTAYKDYRGSNAGLQQTFEHLLAIVYNALSYVIDFRNNSVRFGGPYYGDDENVETWRALERELQNLVNLLNSGKNQIIDAAVREEAEAEARNSAGTAAADAVDRMNALNARAESLERRLSYLNNSMAALDRRIEEEEERKRRATLLIGAASTERERLRAAGIVAEASENLEDLREKRQKLNDSIGDLPEQARTFRAGAQRAEQDAASSIGIMSQDRIRIYQRKIDNGELFEEGLPPDLRLQGGKVTPRRGIRPNTSLPDRSDLDEFGERLERVLSTLSANTPHNEPDSKKDDAELLAAIGRVMQGIKSETSGTSVQTPYGSSEDSDLLARARKGAGNYEVRPRKAREGRNPVTGETIRTGGESGSTVSSSSSSSEISSGTSQVATAETSGFVGDWKGDGGCSLNSILISPNFTLKGAGPDILLSVNGNEATGQGAVLFGIPGHKLSLRVNMNQLQMDGSNDDGGSCISVFTRVQF